jgi:hypothetical protein
VTEKAVTATIKPAPVRRTLTVRAPQARAFEVFTAGFGRWWPAGHSIGKSPQKAGGCAIAHRNVPFMMTQAV